MVTWLIPSLVAFSVCVMFFWVGMSVYVLARYAWNVKKLRETKIGRVMEKTAYGALVACGLVVAAAVGRWVLLMLGV